MDHEPRVTSHTPIDYRHTLNLPTTPFPMKANLPQREPQQLARWAAEELPARLRAGHAGRKKRILHDGPPYANGAIHMGHAFNKILKDLIVKYWTMQGHEATFVPGWDCHGMPIEHQLLKERRQTKQEVDRLEFRRAAAAYAQRFVQLQRAQFQRLGVFGDWDHPYLTMDPAYEAGIIRVFAALLEAGYIYRGKKPVYWCVHCETALADAEVEYAETTSPSIYVTFPIQRGPAGLPPGTAVVIWTTTPWTLPANSGLAFHPDAPYVAVRTAQDQAPEHLLVAESRLAPLQEFWGGSGGEPRIVWRGTGRELGAPPGGEGLRCANPLVPGRVSEGLLDDTVAMNEGTGIVHIAPGHGDADYRLGQRYGLEPFSPVDAHGRFTQEAGSYAGLPVFETHARIIADLKSRERLLKAEEIRHAYPHCWRCQEPVIFRATPQWFLSVEHRGLRARLLDAVGRVRWVPPIGASRIQSMLATRPDWCLSRQRLWGVAIPIVACTNCDRPVMERSRLEHAASVIAREGSTAWFTRSIDELFGGGLRCACGRATFRKEEDILDVWFDSGVSHEAVLRRRDDLGWPADLYLEGSDQHRGWFQVSLIVALALHDAPPYRQVLTHGFVVDGAGRKMSKSLGNVIAPQEILEQSGADILRLWVAASDYAEDIRISQEILARTSESYRKIRNTLRFLLANLYDFNPAHDRVASASLPELDRWALSQLERVRAAVTEAFEHFQFHRAVKILYTFCVVELSAFYLDVLKDRLYTSPAASSERRAAQTVFYDILEYLTRLLAPILPFTAEEAWEQLRARNPALERSVHEASWPAPQPAWSHPELEERWKQLLEVREVVLRELEVARGHGLIGTALEAHVTLRIPRGERRAALERARDTLATLFVVSAVTLSEILERDTGELTVEVTRAAGAKCARCWMWTPEVGTQAHHPRLCRRCCSVILDRTTTTATTS